MSGDSQNHCSSRRRLDVTGGVKNGTHLELADEHLSEASHSDAGPEHDLLRVDFQRVPTIPKRAHARSSRDGVIEDDCSRCLQHQGPGGAHLSAAQTTQSFSQNKKPRRQTFSGGCSGCVLNEADGHLLPFRNSVVSSHAQGSDKCWRQFGRGIAIGATQ